MTRAAGLAAVNCTSCGAGLNLLGGGRVVVHICPYCGAALDAQDGYRLLSRYDKRERPATPFALGMTGRLMGVDWRIIGTIGQQDGAYDWVEHQLYSATHGYAWLTWDSGNATFSRRVRKPSTPAWLDSRTVELADQPPKVLLNGARYTYYETTVARITYLEGEFTWTPGMGEETVTVSVLSDTAMLDFSTSYQSAEREMYRSVWLSPADLRQGFGLKDLPAPAHRHPLKPFSGNRHDGFIFRTAMLCAVAALVLAAGVSLFTNTTTILPPTPVRLAALPQTLSFDVTETDRLVRLDLRSDPENAWLFVALEVEDPEGETLFESGRSMEYYSGRDSEGSWTEGDPTARLQFRPPQAGSYQLVLTESETELWQDGSPPVHVPTDVVVSAKQNVPSAGWLVLLAVGFGLLACVPRGRRMLHKRRQFAGSDWSED